MEEIDKFHSRKQSLIQNSNLNDLNMLSPNVKKHSRNTSSIANKFEKSSYILNSLSNKKAQLSVQNFGLTSGNKQNKERAKSRHRKLLLVKECNEECKNLHIIKRYEEIIKELVNENERLKKINDHIMISLNRKDDYLLHLMKDRTANIYYKTVTNENFNRAIKETVQPHTKSNNISSYEDNSINKGKNLKNYHKEGIPILKLDNMRRSTIKPIIIEKSTPNNSKGRHSFRPSLYNFTKTHYEEVSDFFSKKITKDRMRDARASFLSMPEHVLSKIISQEVIQEILKLTTIDEDFISAMRTYPEEKLLMFADSISTLIKDYEYSINLIARIKRFLSVSVRVVSTMILEDAINMLIRNSCEILDCDRSTIYVHDKVSNMLVIHSGDGLEKGDWKVPSDKGIVGHVFTTGEKQKIDDVYLDDRFNRDLDKKTGYRTKSMLCIPLRDEEGIVFGVIQSLNKKNGSLFTVDDEELMEVFGNQASSILRNSMKFDDTLSFSSRLKMLINFSLKMRDCKTLVDFTQISEQLLMILWATNLAQVLVCDGDHFKHFSESKCEQKPNNIGLVSMSLKRKEIICVHSVYDNPFFNNLIDIESGFSLITFPIYETNPTGGDNMSKVLAVCQVGYPLQDNKTSRIKQNDETVINYFTQISSIWLTEYIKLKDK